MSDLSKLRRFIRFPTRNAARIRQEIDEELKLHVDLRAEALERTGMSPAAARAEAVREFGDREDAARYCIEAGLTAERRRRRRDWLADALQDARHTLRLLRRAPAFTAATVLTLGFAVGASTAVYSVLHTYLVRALPFPEGDRIVRIAAATTREEYRRVPPLETVDWTSVDSIFDATVTLDIDGFTIPGEPYAEVVVGSWVSRGFFRTFAVGPALGRGFAAEEYAREAPVALISHALWVRRFAADSSVVGRAITVHSADRPDAPTLVTIVGVLPSEFWPVHWRESDVLRPLQPGGAMPVFALLKDGVGVAESRSRLHATVRAQLTGPVDPLWHMALLSARDEHAARARPILLAVFGAALFMLLAACGSVAGALVSRMAMRAHELGVRLALGGSRARLVRQLLTESAVLALVAGVIGLVFAYVLLDAGGAVVEENLGTAAPGGVGALRPTLPVMLQSLLVSMAVGAALGLVPALSFLRFERRAGAAAVITGGRSSSARAGGTRVRKLLIAGQVSLAVVLLFGAGLMFRTLARMSASDLGFHAEGAFGGTLLLPAERYGEFPARRQAIDRVLAQIAATPGVRSAAAVFPLPFQGWDFELTAEGGAADESSGLRAGVFTVSPSYFETMGMSMQTGRNLLASDDHTAPLVVVISETLARQLAQDGDVIGRRIRTRVPNLSNFNDVDEMPWRTVVGVVNDTRHEFSSDPLADVPEVYVPYAQNPRDRQAIVVRTDRAEATMLEPVRGAVSSFDPALAFEDVTPLSEIVADQSAEQRGMSVLLGAFAVFALVLSVLALYASLSYTVVQRRSELAVRMAIGASTRSILRLVAREGLATTLAGVGAGIATSLALGKVLQNQVYGIGTNDPLTLVVVSLVLAVAALAACVIPGLRAARTDPALTLRD